MIRKMLLKKLMERTQIKEYLFDSYKFATTAVVLDQVQLDQGIKIKLSNTVFHPQGGGQPNDIGRMIQGEKVFNIKSAEIDRTDDRVWHVGEYLSTERFEHLSTVEVIISEEVRRINARLHSAGHLLDIAVRRLGYPLVPGKGYHFPEGSYVEYVGNVNDKDQALQLLNIECQKILEGQSEPVSVMTLNQEEASKVFEVPSHLAGYNEIRYVKLNNEDNGCPCGGTHVKHIQEIGRVIITKIQKKGKNLRVSYKLD